MKKLIFIYIIGIISISGFSQEDLVTLDSFEAIGIGDTLSVRYENTGCRVKYVYQYLIYKYEDAFELIYYEVPNVLILDGKEIRDFKKKEQIMLDNASNSRREINLFVISNLLTDIEMIINSNNDSVERIAGAFSILRIKLKNEILEKEFKGWINIMDNKN